MSICADAEMSESTHWILRRNLPFFVVFGGALRDNNIDITGGKLTALLRLKDGRRREKVKCVSREA